MRILKYAMLLVILVSVPSVLAQSPMMAPCASMHHHMNPLQISWIDCQRNSDEVVVIVNGTSQDMDLTGYTLTSQSGQTFLFEPVSVNDNCCTVRAYDVLRLHSGPRNDRPFDDPRDLHWLTKRSVPDVHDVWNDDTDNAELKDAHGNMVDMYQY